MNGIAKEALGLLSRNRVEDYEEVVRGETKLGLSLGELAAKNAKLTAIGLDGDILQSLSDGIRALTTKMGEVKVNREGLAKKKYAVEARIDSPGKPIFQHHKSFVEL